MALQILSDLDQWREIAHTDNGDGTYTVTAEAYALVVLGSQIIGMGEITEKTVERYWHRLLAYESLGSSWLMTADGEPVPLTLDMVRKYIGVRTNVFPMMTDAKFRSHLGGIAMDRVRDRIRWAERTAAKAAQEAATAQ